MARPHGACPHPGLGLRHHDWQPSGRSGWLSAPSRDSKRLRSVLLIFPTSRFARSRSSKTRCYKAPRIYYVSKCKSFSPWRGQRLVIKPLGPRFLRDSLKACGPSTRQPGTVRPAKHLKTCTIRFIPVPQFRIQRPAEATPAAPDEQTHNPSADPIYMV